MIVRTRSCYFQDISYSSFSIETTSVLIEGLIVYSVLALFLILACVIL